MFNPQRRAIEAELKVVRPRPAGYHLIVPARRGKFGGTANFPKMAMGQELRRSSSVRVPAAHRVL
jgi:hypothetical protein